ncbi:hypothetical protein R5W24_002274 [Gemmata sp. JC717]|uniref:hypothetical protein n=1 Tax=Gemmata algarum TaxID=2975278 RepID=UPI0021BAE27D|nr:hypothetical protein [Gemmata algarum]MDY3553182.1 hypothetical protein [Gemmata algarum]
MVRAKALGLPENLILRFATWIERFWGRLKDDFDLASFNAEGRALAVALKAVVGTGTEVVFEAEAENGLAPPEIIHAA